MKRNPYFPRANGNRSGWFTHFASELPGANATLALPAASVTNIVADATQLAYATGPWLLAAREFGPAATAGLKTLFFGTNPGPMALPDFVAPDLAGGGTPVPVAEGALNRIFQFVQTIKSAPTYTEAIGLQLGIVGIVGGEDTVEHEVPTFTLVAERGGGTCECVKIKFNKFDREGVLIQSRRGGSMVWEMLAIDLASPYLDERPLLVAGTPEVREYRLQFYDDSAPSGDFSDPQNVTVTP